MLRFYPRASMSARHAQRFSTCSILRGPVDGSGAPPPPSADSTTCSSDGEAPVLTAPAVGSPLRPRSPRTGYLYFNDVFPIRIGMWDLRYLFAQMEQKALEDKVKGYLPDNLPFNFEFKDVFARVKDGGVFVKFRYTPPPLDTAELELARDRNEPEEESVNALKLRQDEEIERVINQKIGAKFKDQNSWPWSLWPARRGAFVVRGSPWLEDMNRFPSNEIRVEFEGPEIPQEEVYEVFRPFGKIHDITPQPSADKTTPRYAIVRYVSIRSATAARNCLHQAVIPSTLPLEEKPTPTVLRILYCERRHANYVKDWVANHPRIALPVIVALLGFISYTIFDPMRQFFVSMHVCEGGTVHYFGWLKSEASKRLPFLRHSPPEQQSQTVESERDAIIEQLSVWVQGDPDTFSLLLGPKGSGKTAILEHAVASKGNVVIIDCGKIAKAASRGETRLVSELAEAVGYWPLFSFGSQISTMMDLASVGLIGQKAGFSATLDSQIKSILDVTTTALTKIFNSIREENQKRVEAAKLREQELKVKQGLEETAAAAQAAGSNSEGVEMPTSEVVASKDENQGKTEAVGSGKTPEEVAKAEEAASVAAAVEDEKAEKELAETTKRYRANSSENKISVREDQGPIVVLKNFNPKSATSGEGGNEEIFYNIITQWAVSLVENGSAHVLFTSDNVMLPKLLARYLPTRTFNTILLKDATEEDAISLVESRIFFDGAKKLSPLEKRKICQVGGRRTDLELVIQKVLAGVDLCEAVDDIIMRNVAEVKKYFFEEEGESWTKEQVWYLAKRLNLHKELKYSEVLVNPPFNNKSEALRVLEDEGLIIIEEAMDFDSPTVIKSARPILKTVFNHLLRDTSFATYVEYDINLKKTQKTQDVIKKHFTELGELSQLAMFEKQPVEVQRRVSYLLKEIKKYEDKHDALDKEREILLKLI